MLKILHTADIHLGAKMSFLEDRANVYRQGMIETLESIYDQAVKNKVDLVVFAGDIFDTPYPSKTTIDIVKNLFKKLADEGIYVAVIPGNHDYLAKGGVYDQGDVAQGDMKIIIFNNPQHNVAKIKELGLSIYASPNITPTSKQSPLPKMQKPKQADKNAPLNPAQTITTQGSDSEETPINIAIAHGSAEVKGEKADNYPITADEIASSGFNYIALGDWHKTLDVSAGKVKAFYPGALEPLAVDQTESGNVLLVEIEQGKTVVKPLRIGKYSIVNIELEVKDEQENLIEMIQQKLDEEAKTGEIKIENLLLNVTIQGIKKLGSDYNISELENYFQSKVFHIRVNENTSLEISIEELQKFPDYTIAGKFIKYIQERDDLDEKLKNAAIQKGLKILLGGNM